MKRKQKERQAEKEKEYIVSSLIYLLPEKGQLVDVLNQTAWHLRDPRTAEALFFFREPHTIQEGVVKGLPSPLLQQLIQNKILISKEEDDPLWIEHFWNRAAFLLFSQRDLFYIDTPSQKRETSLDSLIEKRRLTIVSYQKQKQYPHRFLPKIFLQEISLPPPQQETVVPNLDLLKQRTSERLFRNTPVPLDVFSRVLFFATRNIRAAENTKKSGPLFLLNSFYAWVLLYVYVQAVEGIPSGIYYYDPLAHRLLLIRKGTFSQKVARAVQGQFWFRGGGFCVFVGAQWERYAWLYRHSRAYLNLFIQVGELAQEFTAFATTFGLDSWLTPAVNETLAKRLCCGEENYNGDFVLFMKFGFSVKRHPPTNVLRRFRPEQDRPLFSTDNLPLGLATSDFDLAYEQAHLVSLGAEKAVAIRAPHKGIRLLSIPKTAPIAGLRLLNVPEDAKKKLERRYHIEAHLRRVEFFYHRKKFANRLQSSKNFKRFVKRYHCEVSTKLRKDAVLALFERWQQSFRARDKRVPSDKLLRSLMHPRNRSRYRITFVHFYVAGTLAGVKVVYPYSQHATKKVLIMRYKLLDHQYVGLDKFMDYTVTQMFPEYNWITDGGDFVDEAFKSRYEFKLRQRKPDKQVPLYTVTILGPTKHRES